MLHFGLPNAEIPVRNKVILTKMVVWTILGHFGPVHFPTVLRPLPKNAAFLKRLHLRSVRVCVLKRGVLKRVF